MHSDIAVDYYSYTDCRQHAGISVSSVCVVFCTDVPLYIWGFSFFLALWSEREIKQSSTKLFSVFFPTGRMENKLNQRLWAIRAKKKKKYFPVFLAILKFFPFPSFSDFFLTIFYSFSLLSCLLSSLTAFLCFVFLSYSYMINIVHMLYNYTM